MKNILQYLFDHHVLSRAEAKTILMEIAQNKFNDTEVTAFISVFLMRNISLSELEGFQEALLQLAIPVDLGTRDLVDIVGTGGDGKNTFNISTLASFIVAGAGQKVAKHGNYGVSSTSGSSNVLEQLGYVFKNNQEDLKKDLDLANICFIHAPLFHPALKTVAPLRKNLGLRTFFNILGPLVNPARPDFSMIGVYNSEIARIYQYLLQKQKEKFMLVHALDGYDEISLTEDTKIFSEQGEEIYTAEDLQFKTIEAEAIFGGETKEAAAEIFKQILLGRGSEEQNAVVLANAAMALKNTGKYGSYSHCLELAKESLFSGKANQCLELLVNN
ncbi:anthranilate phosphoribosyltransferase [Elizabethkingia sp. JS20170427COW]|uniref:anthranilate phosphoribosyltransferase n=1 Tax=Elizabethkingia sp. JS20170427COW TaxID=2583851 RepID=UPI0011108267|nr:anthranilate phosphoribosyltransferase [Elizabethkingia sp. JS20170427COW]QCX53970.1 anthranilate phosphoribosyltransferase [Elizabethkingia sp. JS20170427COW]